jgi:hypothetical protein
MTSAVAVLTHESLEDIFERGGTGHWGTKAERAKQHQYVVCVRNRNHPRSPEDVPHRAAFVVGRIAGIVETNHLTEAGIPRVLIKFSHCAIVERHDAWGKSQNPVWYTSLENLGLDLGHLKFKPMPPSQGQDIDCLPPHTENSIILGSTADILTEAKKDLAQRLRLPVANIEITVKV